jgi:hypothetical protein
MAWPVTRQGRDEARSDENKRGGSNMLHQRQRRPSLRIKAVMHHVSYHASLILIPIVDR